MESPNAIFNMTVSKKKIRKEVHLTKRTIDALQKIAEIENRSLKNLMEDRLIQAGSKK